MKISELKKWLSEKGTGQRIAYFLNYKSSTTIDKWISKGTIPYREIEKIQKIMRGEIDVK